MTGATTGALIEVRDLQVTYRTEKAATRPVDGVSFSINPREVVGLIGDAGSGKSTTALALLGLARPPGKITGGQILFGGQDLLSLPDEALRAIRGRDIGIIVQNPRASLNPMLRVGRQIGFAYQAHNRATNAEAQKQAIEMLRMVGINDPERRAEAFAHELSGGMAQRALIAMALSSRPKLLIADEPTSGLDVTIQAQFLDQMWQTVQDTGSAILLITQELGVIANYCDRVLVLHEGRIVEDAPVRQFFEAPAHPYSREVVSLRRVAATAATAASGPAAQAPPLVTLDALTKHFPLRGSDKVVQAVDRVTLTIGKGEAVGLVGESGSGKTTVGRCLLQLVPPTAGRIAFAGTDITALPKAELRRLREKMQIVFQDPFDSLNPRWTLAEILAEPLRIHAPAAASAHRARAAEALRLVDLDPALLDRRPRGLGASTLQRVNIARALILNPEFVVLDEPTSVLAPRARTSLIALLARLQAELGISFLFISHDLTTVRYLCQRVAVMYLGQIVEEGTVEQVFGNPRHPYSQALLSAHLFPDPAHRRVDYPVPAALQGEIPSPIDVPKGCYLASRCPHAVDACRAEPQQLSALADGRQVRCARVVRGEL
jgi:oligopeptide/dipeptide ABC transporter ATP-binding protein